MQHPQGLGLSTSPSANFQDVQVPRGGRERPALALPLTHQVTLMRSRPSAGLLPIGPEGAVLQRWEEN